VQQTQYHSLKNNSIKLSTKSDTKILKLVNKEVSYNTFDETQWASRQWGQPIQTWSAWFIV